MASPSLLDINVDALFEQHSIAEIAQIHKKLQSDVEHKKEELRTMVGERYRDLLKAADTIGEMKSTATSVTGHIEEITATCRSLNDQQLIGFKSTSTYPQRLLVDRGVQNFYGIAVQIKLLTQLPELIWSNIDAENFFVATQLFIFSRHISTGLQLDINRPIVRSFPVAKQLWSTLSPFYHTIRHACLATLERAELSAATAAKCLASLMLLENCSMDKLLGTLIQLRGKSFKAALSADEHERRVQEKILSSLKVLIDTLDLIHKCFVNGLVMLELSQLTEETAKPTIDLLGIEDAVFVERLPDIIRKYRPNVTITELAPESFKQLMASWLQYTSNDCKRQIQLVIDGIASVKTIHRIKQEVFAIKKPNTWSTILDSLYLPSNLDLYLFCYQPLINDRVKQIIKQSWSQTIEQTHQEVESGVNHENISDKDSKCLTKWSLIPADIPLSLKQALSQEKQCHRLLMKSKGYSASIITICQSLDDNLKTIYDEVNLYLNKTSTTDSTSEDNSDVIRFLQETSRESVSDLISAIKSTKGFHSKSTLIYLATLLKSIIELCPNLKLCMFQWDKSASVAKTTSEEWDSVCALLEEESFHFWTQWITTFTKEYENHFDTTTIDFQILSRELLTWETITIEEKDELDQPIESNIRVPSHVSVSLQQFWHLIGRGLNNVVPYALPKPVTQSLTVELTRYLYGVYQTRADHAFVKSSQNASLQFYFDAKFIQTVFVLRENKTQWEQWQQLTASFKANVDPFDFELFHKYLTLNVKKSVHKMQHKLGVLLANADHLTSVLATGAPGTTGHDKEPNVLTLSSINESSGWFSMLPVMQTTTNKPPVISSSDSTVKTKRSKPQASTTATPSTVPLVAAPKPTSAGDTTAQNLANVKQSAASFFGAMSKEWFQ